MASGYTVSNLSAYVEENKDVLIKNVILGNVYGDTINNLTKQFGIKTSEKLNYLNVDPVLQDGRGCGFNPSGSTEFSERQLDTAIFKVNDQFCADTLLGKFAEYQVRIGANPNAENLPFEAEITNGIVEGINEKMEKAVWQGKTAATVSGGTDLIDGFITLAENQDSASTISVSIATGTSVYNAIKAVILQIPEEILDKAMVFVAPAIYRQYIQELVEKNFFHYNPAEGAPKDMFFPGTNVKVHNTVGLKGDKRHIYASCYENMVYGTDAMNDKEEFRIWFSDDADLHRIKVKWNAGVMTYFPDYVVLGTGAGDLV